MKLFRENLLIAAAAVLLCACGSQRAGEGAGATSTLPESAASAEPSVEPTGQPEKPQPPGGGGPSIPVPTLPVGGDGDDSEVHQCVIVNWLGDSAVPKNVSVLVQAIQITPAGVFDKGAGCGGTTACGGGFAFTAARTKCSVAVTAKAEHGRTARLSLGGVLRCPTGQERMCREFAGTITPQSIELRQPGEPPTTDENPPTSTG